MYLRFEEKVWIKQHHLFELHKFTRWGSYGNMLSSIRREY